MVPVGVVNIILAFVFLGLSLVITAFRLVVRRRNLWLDDLCASIALGAFIAHAVIVAVLGLGALPLIGDNPTKVALYYLQIIAWYFENWMARLALLYSIIRIAPNHRMRSGLHIVAWIFIVLLIANCVVFIGFCERDHAWHYSIFPVCAVPKPVPIIHMATSVPSDLLLIYLPLQILGMLTSAPSMRRRLKLIFSASILMSFACIAQGVVILSTIPGIWQLISSLVEGFISLIVCNLAIVSVAVMHLFGYDERTTHSTTTLSTATGIRFRTLPYGHNNKHSPEQSDMTYTMRSLGDDSSEGISSGVKPEPEIEPESPADIVVERDCTVTDIHAMSRRPRRRSIFIDRWRTMDVDVNDREASGEVFEERENEVALKHP